MTVGVLVEGVNDRARIHKVDDTVKCFLLFGTPKGAKLRSIVNRAIAECDRLYIMTDPDDAGNLAAEHIQREFPELQRVNVDPMKCRIQRRARGNYRYGVEYCSLSYIRELLDGIKEESQ